MAGSKRRKRGRGRGRENGRHGSNGGEPRCERRAHEMCTLGPFAVFCAYYLGITQNDGYSEPNPGRVARHFGMTPEELDVYLEKHRLTPRDLAASGFDLDAALEDIKVAPSGISRVELARSMYLEVGGEDSDAEPDGADEGDAYLSK